MSAISGVLLISASGAPSAEDIEEHLRRAGQGSRPVVIDLTKADVLNEPTIRVLRRAWQELGDRLRVVAPPATAPAEAIKREGLRRFAVHASLGGALTHAGGGRRTRRQGRPRS